MKLLGSPQPSPQNPRESRVIPRCNAAPDSVHKRVDLQRAALFPANWVLDKFCNLQWRRLSYPSPTSAPGGGT